MTVLAPKKCVVVGEKFAELLGYQEMVGAMGVIDKVMNALCAVTILTGEKAGTSFDIHKEDCLAEEETIEPYAVVANLLTNKLYYSTNEDFVEYLADNFGHHTVTIMRNVDSAPSEVLHEFTENVLKKNGRYGGGHEKADWMIYSLDVETPDTKAFRDTYQAEMAVAEAEREAEEKANPGAAERAEQLKLSIQAQLEEQFKKKQLESQKMNPFDPFSHSGMMMDVEGMSVEQDEHGITIHGHGALPPILDIMTMLFGPPISIQEVDTEQLMEEIEEEDAGNPFPSILDLFGPRREKHKAPEGPRKPEESSKEEQWKKLDDETQAKRDAEDDDDAFDGPVEPEK